MYESCGLTLHMLIYLRMSVRMQVRKCLRTQRSVYSYVTASKHPPFAYTDWYTSKKRMSTKGHVITFQGKKVCQI